jgi:Peptidase family M1 domain
VYGLLSRHFGSPAGNRFGAVQARSWQDNPGWRFTSNTIVVAAATPGFLSLQNPIPAAPLGHEVAHLWTEGVTGPAAAFLGEGWAVWAEGLVVETEFGADTARTFWKSRAEMYFMAFDGKDSLVEDRRNAGVAYWKGPWIYRMLEEAIGVERFNLAMAEYWAAERVQRLGWEDLANTVQKHAPAGFDARLFLLPWLTGKHAPHLTAEVKGSTVIIHSDASEFILPVTVEATTNKGRERSRIWIRGAATPVTFSADVLDVKIDPDELLLIHL